MNFAGKREYITFKDLSIDEMVRSHHGHLDANYVFTGQRLPFLLGILKQGSMQGNDFFVRFCMLFICSFMGILWKQKLHKRTETRVCIFPGQD